MNDELDEGLDDDDDLGVLKEALSGLPDDELEAELTIAAQNPGLEARYEALLAEHERRRNG